MLPPSFEPRELLAHSHGWDDGVTHELDDSDRDEFAFRGRTLRVQWMEGTEARELLAARGW